MKTVLIATERDLEQNLLAQSLESQGYAILRSRDGLDTLELARNSAPNLLLLNVALPRLDGFALFRRCQQDEQLRQIPVVLFSTRSKDEKSGRFAQELGVTHFVGDALRSSTLAQTVAAALATENTAVLPALLINVVKPPPVVASPEPVKVVEPLPAVPAVNEAVLIAQAAELQALRSEQTQQQALSTSIQSQLLEARSLGELFASSPVSMWVVDKASQRIMAANRAASQLFGYSQTELLQLNSQNLLRVDSAAQGGSTQVFSFQHEDGHGLSLLLNVCDVVFSAQPAELMAAQDVSYRVRGERAMADEIQRLKLLLTALPVAYCICDGEGQIRDANESSSVLLGKTREQLIGQSIATLLVDQAQWPSLHALSAGEPVSLQFADSDGKSLPVSVTRGMAELSAGLHLYLLHLEPQPIQVPAAVIQGSAKLPAMLEILRYSEDADEATLLQYAVAQLAHAFNSPLALFAVLENVTQTMEVLAVSQRHSQRRNQHSLSERLSMPSAWRPLLTSRAVCTSDKPDDSLLMEGLPEISSFQACSVAPSGRELWLLLTGNREIAYTTEEQIELQNCAELLGMLLLRKRQQLLVHSNHQRHASVATGTVSLLEKIIDQHDVYAAASGSRVARLALAIARQMNLSAAAQVQLQLAARLHDIGHLLLPQTLLLKPSSLNTAEQMLVHSHAERGAQLLRSVDLGVDIADIVAQHHERLDGSGYPAGLRDEQIGIEARILAVADVVEAMCAARAYRPELGLTAALLEIQSGAGRLYDAMVVQTCEQIFRQTENQWPEALL